MHDFKNKSEDELQSEIEKAFAFSEGNNRGEVTAQLKVLLVIAERNRRHIEYIERKNKIYTYVIIGLSVAAILAQILPIFISNCLNN